MDDKMKGSAEVKKGYNKIIKVYCWIVLREASSMHEVNYRCKKTPLPFRDPANLVNL